MLGLKKIGGQSVKAGNYWNFSTGERIILEKDGILPGGSSVTYFKTHPLVILLASPILGLVYAVFLPFIGVFALLNVVFTKVLGGSISRLSKIATFGWRPAEAYLSGKKNDKGKRKEEKANHDNKETPKQE